jgi:hypothetical protein
MKPNLLPFPVKHSGAVKKARFSDEIIQRMGTGFQSKFDKHRGQIVTGNPAVAKKLDSQDRFDILLQTRLSGVTGQV